MIAKEYVNILRANLMILMWFKMFDWLRMFEITSFYVSLIVQTVKDLTPFFTIFPIFLITFGSATYILDTEKSEFTTGDWTSSWVFNAIFTQYLLSQGAFVKIDAYEESSHEIMVYIIFMIATFFSTITALNMIIAIMSDTFARVTESYQ